MPKMPWCYRRNGCSLSTRKLTMGYVLTHRDSKIDLDNPYYHEYDEWVEKHKKADLSVEDIGGLEWENAIINLL